MNDLYLSRMKQMIPEEFDSFLSSLSCEPRRGLRVNTLKIDEKKFFDLTKLQLEKSPFAENGYFLHGEEGLGKTPAYFAGLFYIQEPSASSAVTILDPKPGMRVLDMCAAPGSKSTQIAEKLENTGLLVVNEINAKRASVLNENIERCGTANTLILNADTSELKNTFSEYFDMVLCDAPCSGEGMMRKNSEAESQWSLNLVNQCARLQAEIIENAYTCLKPGGTMVYSTCTFSKEENEDLISQFLKKHTDMHVCDTNVSFGRKAFQILNEECTALRIFPMDGGEGHFVCKMKKDGESTETTVPLLKSDPMAKNVKEFLSQNLERQYPYYYSYKNRIYGGIHPFIKVENCRMIRHQVYLGELKNNRFEPSHHFFTSCYTKHKRQISLDEIQCQKYLRGEALTIPLEKGWYAVQWNGYTIGGAYSDGKILKNKFPKSLRLR